MSNATMSCSWVGGDRDDLLSYDTSDGDLGLRIDRRTDVESDLLPSFLESCNPVPYCTMRRSAFEGACDGVLIDEDLFGSQELCTECR